MDTPPNTKPVNEAVTSMAAQLDKYFPGGFIPDGGVSTVDAATGATGAAPEPAATGATGAAPEPAATGATGGTGVSDSQLDAAEKGMDLKAGTAFRIVREREAAAIKELADFKASIAQRDATAGTNPEANKQLEELKSIVADYEKVLAVKSIEDTADFKRNITDPLLKADKGLEGLAQKHSISLADLQSALADPDPAKRSDRLSELSANFNRFDMNQFDRLVMEVDRLRESKQTAIAQAAENWKTELATQQQKTEQARAAFEADWRRALDVSFTKLQDSLPILKKGQDADINAKIDAIKTRVSSLDIAKMPNDELVASLYRSEVLDIILNQNADLTEKNLAKDEQLSKLRGTTPPAGGGDKPPGEGATGPKVFKTAEEAFKESLKGVLPSGVAS